jgi:acyl-phosphate glycerol 3-phosphate acyltransferase
MIPSFSWIIFSYLLGSIPFGYLISRKSGKDILKIGWRKTSGSNVFKNVGKRQGMLTGILDLLKGYLVVFGAQKLGLSTEIQVLSGVAAVTGHNWSLYLKFAGGRGIGTFIGAFFALSPKVLGLSIIPFALLSIIWDASIGTLIFLATAIFFSFYPGFLPKEIWQVGLFPVFSLVPILIKRLSPIKEIKKSQNRTTLIRNRLIFDDDKAHSIWRIKRMVYGLLNKKTNQAVEAIKLLKPVANSLLIPSKIGWEVAKMGVGMAKRPIQKLIFKSPEKIVTCLKPEDIKKMMVAGAKKIVLHQEEINKINVWPVNDKDTGYNLAATLLGIEGVTGHKKYNLISELVQDVKEGAMTNARGNAGLIYAGYLVRVLDEIKNSKEIDALKFGRAMRKGIKGAYLSIVKPIEGTILDVIGASGEKAYETAKIKKEKNIIKILEEALKISEMALKETKEKLPALKRANVVDAGALGFVKILEAWVESLEGKTPAPKIETEPLIFEPKLKEKLPSRYEIMFTFKKPANFKQEMGRLKRELSLIGESIDVVELDGEAKIHIHTNFPEKVKEKIKEFEVSEWRVEDMRPAKVVKKEPIGLVAGQTADLPKEFLEKNQVEEVPFRSRFPDGEILSRENLFPKIKEAVKRGKPLPTTSTPSFGDFLTAYQKALEKFEKILVITLSSKLSGTYSSARIARSIYKKPEKNNIFVFDCFTAEVGEGLVAIKAQELISQGKNLEEILDKLKEFCPKIKFLGLIDDFKYIARSGRIKLLSFAVKPLSLLQKAGIKVLIEVENGKAKFLGIRLGKDAVKVLVKEIEKKREGKEIKLAIAQADNLKMAEELKKELEKKQKVKVLFISSVSPIVGTYTGPGSILVAFHPVE